MQHLTFPGGWYADHLPTGQWCVLFPQIRTVRTHVGNLPQIPNDYPLFLDSFFDGTTYKIAGKAHDSLNTWEWTGSAWVAHEEAIGNFSVLYDREGLLLISKGGAVGVQGWRQYLPDGTLVTGDASYGPFRRLNEYSYIAPGIYIGQGNDVGGVCVSIDNTLHMLTPGVCYDVKAKPLGNTVAISFYDVAGDGLTAHILTATIDELRALPVVPVPAPPPPVVQPPAPPPPPPPVTPEPAPMSDVLATLKTVRAKFGVNNTPEQLGAMLNEVAWIHRAEGVGLERKDGGFTAIQPKTGVHVASDILRFPGNVGRDVLGDADGAAVPSWGDAGPADPARFVAPVEPSDVVVVTPGPVDPGPTPTPVNSFASASAILEARIASIAAAIAKLTATIDELEKRPVVIPTPAETPSLNGARIALKTDNGHFVSAQDGGGGVLHAQRPERGASVDGYEPGGWETFTIVTR